MGMLIMVLNLLGMHLTKLLLFMKHGFGFHIAQAMCNGLVYFVGLKLDKP